MSLSKTITKKATPFVQPKLNNIIFNFILADTNGPGFNRDFSVEYRTGENVADKVAKVKIDMQEAINIYKAEQQIFNSAALDNAVIAISEGLVL